MNVASRMESMGMTNAVQISGATYAQLQQQSAPLLNDQDEEDGHAKLPGSRRWVVCIVYILLPPAGGYKYCIYYVQKAQANWIAGNNAQLVSLTTMSVIFRLHREMHRALSLLPK